MRSFFQKIKLSTTLSDVIFAVFLTQNFNLKFEIRIVILYVKKKKVKFQLNI